MDKCTTFFEFGAEMLKLIIQMGFELRRMKGSHAFYRHSDGRGTTTIPYHKGKMMSRPLLRQILNQIDLSIEDFVDLLKNL